MQSANNNTFKKTFIALALLSAASGAGAANVPAGTALAEKQELVRNNGSEPASLDPHKVESDVEFNLISDFFDGLVAIRKDGTVEPRLAEKWENTDSTVWTFHLRPGIKWSNGEPIKAGDIVWSWQRIVSPDTASPYASYPGNMHVENAADIASGKKSPGTLGVKALDDNTLQITLTQPVAAFLAMLAHPSLVAINKAVVEKFGEKWTQPGNFVSSGPYTPVQWIVNEKIVTGRNKQYWDDQHTVLNKVTWLPISSETADINRYKAGEIDIVYSVPQTLFASLKKSMPDQMHVTPKLATYYYEFNTTKPPFNDVRVRRALNMALDKATIANKILAQGQVPAWVISQKEIGGIEIKSPDYASWSNEKRTDEARKLLAEAGYNAQHPLSFTLLYNTSENHKRIAIAVSSMWLQNLGVKVKLQNQEWKTMLDSMHSGNFDVVRYSWIADYDDAATFLNNFRTGDSENTSQYSNPAYDDALKQATLAKSNVERGQYYQLAEDKLAEDVPAIPVYHYVVSQLVKPYVGGYAPNNLGYYYSKDMYIKKH